MKKIIFTLVLLVGTLSKAGDYVSAEITTQDTTTMPIGGGPFPFLVQNISDVPMNINIWGQGWITIDAGVGVPTPRNLGSSGALYFVKVQRADNTGNLAELSGFDDWGWHQLFISLSADGKTPLLYLTATSGGIVGVGGWLAGIPRYFPTSTGVTLTNASTIATSTPAPTTPTPTTPATTSAQLNNQLIAAVRANNSSQVQTLLQQGANPNALDENGNSAIANAAARGYLSIVGTLRNAGGFRQDPNACNWALKAPGGIVAQAQLINALQICDSQVNTLCNSQVNITSLQTAQDSLVNLRHIQSVNANFCVAQIAQVNTAISTQLNNQLIVAVRANNSSQVQTLLQQGANPNALDEHNNSAIANAAARGYLSIVETLRNADGFRQDPNACNWALKAPGGIVAQAQLINALQICDSQVNTLCNSQVNTTSLQTAQDSLVNLQHIQSVNSNFCAAQIDQINTAIAHTVTCLCLWKPGQMAEAPLVQPVTPDQNPCDLCQTVCDEALKTSTPLVGCVPGHYDTVTTVPWAQWKQCRPATPAPTTPIPTTPATTSAQLNNQLIAAVQANNSSQVQTLLQQGANPNALDGNGNSALANAASRGYVAIINVLKAKGADKTIAGPGGQNACYWALNPVISLTVVQQTDVFIALGCPIEPLCAKQVNTSSLAAAQESLTNLTTIGTGACSQQITSVNNVIQSLTAAIGGFGF